MSDCDQDKFCSEKKIFSNTSASEEVQKKPNPWRLAMAVEFYDSRKGHWRLVDSNRHSFQFHMNSNDLENDIAVATEMPAVCAKLFDYETLTEHKFCPPFDIWNEVTFWPSQIDAPNGRQAVVRSVLDVYGADQCIPSDASTAFYMQYIEKLYFMQTRVNHCTLEALREAGYELDLRYQFRTFAKAVKNAYKAAVISRNEDSDAWIELDRSMVRIIYWLYWPTSLQSLAVVENEKCEQKSEQKCDQKPSVETVTTANDDNEDDDDDSDNENDDDDSDNDSDDEEDALPPLVDINDVISTGASCASVSNKCRQEDTPVTLFSAFDKEDETYQTSAYEHDEFRKALADFYSGIGNLPKIKSDAYSHSASLTENLFFGSVYAGRDTCSDHVVTDIPQNAVCIYNNEYSEAVKECCNEDGEPCETVESDNCSDGSTDDEDSSSECESSTSSSASNISNYILSDSSDEEDDAQVKNTLKQHFVEEQSDSSDESTPESSDSDDSDAECDEKCDGKCTVEQADAFKECKETKETKIGFYNYPDSCEEALQTIKDTKETDPLGAHWYANFSELTQCATSTGAAESYSFSRSEKETQAYFDMSAELEYFSACFARPTTHIIFGKIPEHRRQFYEWYTRENPEVNQIGYITSESKTLTECMQMAYKSGLAEKIQEDNYQTVRPAVRVIDWYNAKSRIAKFFRDSTTAVFIDMAGDFSSQACLIGAPLTFAIFTPSACYSDMQAAIEMMCENYKLSTQQQTAILTDWHSEFGTCLSTVEAGDAVLVPLSTGTFMLPTPVILKNVYSQSANECSSDKKNI